MDVKKSGRGGKRAGAGRKKKGYVAPTRLSDLDVKAAMALSAPDDIETAAQEKAFAAIQALIRVMQHGDSESARVKACCSIIDRGYGKPSANVGGDPLLPFLGSAPVREAAPKIRDEARKYANLAIEILHRIAGAAQSDAARRQAADALLDRGLGKVATAQMQDELGKLRQLGKKEQQSQAAEQAGTGLYATPAPPSSHKPTLN